MHGWRFKHNIKFKDNQDLIHRPKVIGRYQREIDRINQTLGQHRQIKKFELTCQEWTPESGELSPTLKLKRRFLKEKYKIKLDRLYDYTDETGDVGLPSN